MDGSPAQRAPAPSRACGAAGAAAKLEHSVTAPEDHAVAHDEVDGGADDDGREVGGDRWDVQSDRQPGHERDVARERDEAVQYLEADEPPHVAADGASRPVAPGPAL